MIFRSIALAGALLMAATAPAIAQQADDDIVRLPGQGFTKPEAHKRRGTPDRLVAGGGLFLSFDTDGDGRITRAELEAGTAAAFAKADANGDGHLTAFEQIKWAESLPTRDDTLANPVRFDPNLDRRVSPEEFETVIAELAEHYVEEYQRTYGLDYKILRYGSLYGPRSSENNGPWRIVKNAMDTNTVSYEGSPEAMRE